MYRVHAHHILLLAAIMRCRLQSAKPKSDTDGLIFLAGSTDPSTNNGPSVVPYFKSPSNAVLVKVLVPLLNVNITTVDVVL